jgi:para-aminobenzoate synthetase component 1
MNALPLVEELPSSLDSEDVFLRMCSLPHCIFCDSVAQDPTLGRFSFLAADPFDFIEIPAHQCEGVSRLASILKKFSATPVPDLPPFQGGAAGLFSYDLGRIFETIPSTKFDEFGMPLVAIGIYDIVVAFDHATHRAWIISQGYPETEPTRRHQRAAQRLHQAKSWLASPYRVEHSPSPHRASCERNTISRDDLAPQFPVEKLPGLTSDFTREEYLHAVQKAIDYIYAGDIFQVNLSQRLLYPAEENVIALYQRLRRCNPATFASYFDTGDFQILSASPERFLKVHDRFVETRPIKGTRPRTGDANIDKQAEAELSASEKDRAENVMIVDLLRNDLSRVCKADSVRVSQLCEIEAYAYVLHLVSAVQGCLRDEKSPLDLLQATFPGGSVTGAPKVRAMEIIAELEPTARGAYCGSLGYLGFDGSMDLNILIRTMIAGRGWLQFSVGGAVVSQSDPAQEYEETWQKAEGMLRALTKP